MLYIVHLAPPGMHAGDRFLIGLSNSRGLSVPVMTIRTYS